MTTSTSHQPKTYSEVLTHLLPPHTPAPVLQPPSPQNTQAPRPIYPSLTSTIASLELHPALETFLHILNADLASAHFLVRHMQSPPAWEGMLLHALLHRFEGHISNGRAWYTDIAGAAVLEYVWGSDGKVDEARDSAAVKKEAKEATEQERQEKADAGRTDKDADAKHSAQNNADDGDASAPGTSAAQEASQSLPRVTKFLNRVAKVQELATAPHKFEGGKEAFEREVGELREESEVECRRLLAWCEVKFGTESLQDAREEYAPMSEKIAEIATKQVMGGEGWRKF